MCSVTNNLKDETSWRFFGSSYISCEPRAAHFRSAF